MASVSSRNHRPVAWLRVFEESLLAAALMVIAAIVIIACGTKVSPVDVVTELPGMFGRPDDGRMQAMPLVAASRPMMQAVAVATELESHGVFGEAARKAWAKAALECRKFAVQPIATTCGEPVMLWLEDAEQGRAEELAQRLESLLPGRFASLSRQRLESLPPEEAAVTWAMVVAEAPADVKAQAERICQLHEEAVAKAALIHRYKEIVNFDFWRETCEAEASAAALQAREAAWRAEREFEQSSLEAAKRDYEQAFAAWRQVLDAAPLLREDSDLADDLRVSITHYRDVVERLNERFPEPFELQDIVERASAL
jgi:hypothetical protein